MATVTITISDPSGNILRHVELRDGTESDPDDLAGAVVDELEMQFEEVTPL